MSDLTDQRNENLLTPQQQEIVKRIIRAEFDRADQYTAIDVICAGYNMGLPMPFLAEMYDDLLITNPRLENEVRMGLFCKELSKN